MKRKALIAAIVMALTLPLTAGKCDTQSTGGGTQIVTPEASAQASYAKAWRKYQKRLRAWELGNDLRAQRGWPLSEHPPTPPPPP